MKTRTQGAEHVIAERRHLEETFPGIDYESGQENKANGQNEFDSHMIIFTGCHATTHSRALNSSVTRAAYSAGTANTIAP